MERFQFSKSMRGGTDTCTLRRVNAGVGREGETPHGRSLQLRALRERPPRPRFCRDGGHRGRARPRTDDGPLLPLVFLCHEATTSMVPSLEPQEEKRAAMLARMDARQAERDSKYANAPALSYRAACLVYVRADWHLRSTGRVTGVAKTRKPSRWALSTAR